MTLQQQLAQIQDKKKQVKKALKEIQKESENIFDKYCQDFFEKNSELKSFSWSQYTPYFNDGSPCVFSANIDYISVNDQVIDESTWYSEKIITNYGKWDSKTKTYIDRVAVDNPNYNKELSSVCNDIIDFLSTFDDEFYLSKFGDHCTVTITKDGITVDELNHE